LSFFDFDFLSVSMVLRSKTMAEERDITELLMAWSNGEEHALEQLIPLVEQELRRIAHNYMRRESSHHTLQTTALVNEAYINLAGQRAINLQNRAHFFALSAQLMRRILLRYARDRAAEKRGGKANHVSLEDISIMTQEKSIELLALDQALERLDAQDHLKSRIVELRYFGGMTLAEIAEVLGIAEITVSVHWRFAKAWLAREINGENHSAVKRGSK
jgi:RNA polymerase sigma-70 factor (ECF subfamily)